MIEVQCKRGCWPFCGMLLADMGPTWSRSSTPEGGDTLRAWPPINDGYSELRLAEPQQAPLGHAQPRGRGRASPAAQLAAGADIADREQPARRDGAPGRRLRGAVRAQPGWCTAPSPYGQSGPRSQEGSFDLTIQAMSGIMSVTGEADRPPVSAACRWPTSRPACTPAWASLRHCTLGPGQRPGCAPGRADAGRHPRHRRTADLGVLRQRPRTPCAWLRPIRATRHYRVFPQPRRLLRHGPRGNNALWRGAS